MIALVRAPSPAVLMANTMNLWEIDGQKPRYLHIYIYIYVCVCVYMLLVNSNSHSIFNVLFRVILNYSYIPVGCGFLGGVLPYSMCFRRLREILSTYLANLHIP